MKSVSFLSVVLHMVVTVVYGNIICQPINPPHLQPFPQPLDHAHVELGSFDQRIQAIPMPASTSDGPVLFYVGPENAASDYTLPCTSLYDFAQQLGSPAIITAEHRFFGKSWPANMTAETMQSVLETLTLDNILTDYVKVIRHYTQGPEAQYANRKVITFGGSYGGFLSAMLRASFPADVHSAVASAAPVFFTGSGISDGTWYDTVATIYSSFDGECASKMRSSFAALALLFENKEHQRIVEELNLCASPNTLRKGDIMLLAMHAAQVATQFNYPMSGVTKVPFAINATCLGFKQSSAGSLAPLRNLLDISYNKTKTPLKCFGPASAEATKFISVALASARGKERNARDLSFEKSWDYITCTFFNFPIAGGAQAQDFFSYAPPFNLALVKKYCEAKFWKGMSTYTQPPATLSTFEKASRILFSNMFFDPVKAFSVQKSLSETVKLLVIPNAAHTEDVVAHNTDEHNSIIVARDVEKNILLDWLQQS
eukprot:Colp12_sorted_trinity150504_noHs@25149